ncbi:hypothetical protein HMPREF9248_0129 [Fannyhessea vaginae PB189-T1-4]|uniref:Secreted protein n=1 Tax=Fannyhessea vaginae PB189-T1-4 TaxID=866774 RepID=A0ABN0B1I9_9ACTN|nr:hypothetical protein HMPREF9248_0129 [Fannyhessea vaginae PB189-T1-4]
MQRCVACLFCAALQYMWYSNTVCFLILLCASNVFARARRSSIHTRNKPCRQGVVREYR